jgi:hypothetical protein
MAKFNLSEAAKEILDVSVSSKRGAQDGTKKLPTSVVTGQQDVGQIGCSPEEEDDELPDYTKGTPSATPPGATPPVGSAPALKLSGQPQQTMGRSDLNTHAQASSTSYENIRDRIAGKLANQSMSMNPGATFQAYAEDINAMLSGENLSEEFVSKATTIFEAAVVTRATEVVNIIEQELTEQFDVAVEQVKEELSQQVDSFLNYMVNEWMQENQLAIESGLRAELAEDVLQGIYKVFTENNINIPEEKVDLVNELITKVEELEESLNKQIKQSIDLTEELNHQKKIEAIYTACEGLTKTQVEKLKTLAENVEYTTEWEFVKKVETLKESYFKPSYKFADNNALDDEVQFEDEKKPSRTGDVLIEQYARTISQTINK